MKKSILVIVLLVTSLSYSQTITSTQKGYYSAVVGDSVLQNRTTERKAKDDGLNYALKHGFNGYRINFPNYVQVYLEGFEKDSIVVVEPLIEIPTDTIITPPIEVPTDTIITPAPNGKTYILDAETVGIVEGVVSKSVALENVKAWNNTMSNLPNDIEVIQIDNLDAYFDVNDTERWRAAKKNTLFALRLPSNIHLKMSDDTYLRVYPNDSFSFHLLSVFHNQNIKITGGHLVGDRFEHDYLSVTADRFGNGRASHEWGYCLNITSSQNITIDNVHISNSSGDGININSSALRNQDGSAGNSVTSRNITIKNNFIDQCRRNNLSVVDGEEIIIVNNTISRAGLGSGEGIGSWGIAPMAGMDLEAYNENGSNGEIYQYEKVKDVIVRGNTFVASKKADVILFISEDVVIENNIMVKGVAVQYSHNVVIKNNVINATADEDGDMPTSGIATSDSRRVKNIEIHNNKINGFENALILSGAEINAHHNTVTDFDTGLTLGKLIDSQAHDNTYNTDRSVSFGLRSVNGTATGLIHVYNEDFNVNNRGLNVLFYNKETNGNLLIEDCVFNSKGMYINGSKNIELKNITSNRTLEVVNSSNIKY